MFNSGRVRFNFFFFYIYIYYNKKAYLVLEIERPVPEGFVCLFNFSLSVLQLSVGRKPNVFLLTNLINVPALEGREGAP